MRPLLTTSRAEIVAYLEANGVAHVEDSSNTDEGYARNRIRRQVVPVLRQLNPASLRARRRPWATCAPTTTI